jgi:3-hydroxyacyl-[acyl-carrier-protein] dehydratase
MNEGITASLPHRPPFLFVDEVLELKDAAIRTAYTPKPDDELWSRVYAGHYPGSPITPGVLLCEMLFQAAAVLLHEIAKTETLPGVPMVTRITNVKFKSVVQPGSRLEIDAALTERLANAFFMKGSIRCGGKIALQAEFAVAMAEPERDGRHG